MVWGDHTIATVLAEQPWTIWANRSQIATKKWKYNHKTKRIKTVRIYIMEYTVYWLIIATKKGVGWQDVPQVSIRLELTHRPKQNGHHFAGDIFECYLLSINCCILNQISLTCGPMGSELSISHYWFRLQGFLFTQISGHSPIKILKVLNISKLQDNFSIYWCGFYMPLVHLKSKCPVTKFSQQKPWVMAWRRFVPSHYLNQW